MVVGCVVVVVNSAVVPGSAVVGVVFVVVEVVGLVITVVLHGRSTP